MGYIQRNIVSIANVYLHVVLVSISKTPSLVVKSQPLTGVSISPQLKRFFGFCTAAAGVCCWIYGTGIESQPYTCKATVISLSHVPTLRFILIKGFIIGCMGGQ